MEAQRPTPKDLALQALQANQVHQYALAQHAEKLTAELAELDKLLVCYQYYTADSSRPRLNLPRLKPIPRMEIPT